MTHPIISFNMKVFSKNLFLSRLKKGKERKAFETEFEKRKGVKFEKPKKKKETKILGFEEYLHNGITYQRPIIECERSPNYRFTFYCAYCKRNHSHGNVEGHRGAHCYSDKSPFNETGYILKLKENSDNQKGGVDKW